MKKHFIYASIFCMTALGISSCNRDYLSPVPETSVPAESGFATEQRVTNQLLSLYEAMKHGNFYGGRFVIYGDIRGEEFINETSNLVTGSDVWSLNPTNSATAVERLWQYAYLTINKCNIFLDGMANQGTSVVGNDVAARYIAEAKFIRAISYYSLLQYYARPYAENNGGSPGLPLRLSGIVNATGNLQLARSSVAEVYTQILKDLNEAEASLPSNYSTPELNTTRAHKNTAIALKTRVYLTMQSYADVITEANKIVSSTAPFTAPTGVANALQADISTVFSTFNTTESILSMPMTATSGDNPGTQNQLAYYYSPTVGNREYSLNPNGIIANTTWKSTDKRRSFIGTAANKSWLTKYKIGTTFSDYVPVMRYSEVLLNLAEARVRTSNSVDPQAVALLNAVRTRSDATTTFTTTSFANATELINAILLERRIEFLGEGLRNNDLMRLLQTIPAKGTISAKAPSEPGYIWPIAASELSLNPLMKDN
ncbi:RagB/SusD family nutrient uptake outer membrane protein [Siphonobacter sp. SORGH_AS_0500]|uniref:RagB/SusD family nutrient uptake outer membrane protein n=1 Tax=Siphonobacter sp. SORGH_AS_0500 TaxID=1864824 RepID=UPI000CB1C2CA|nr:RagB/SusD family nutrient uptake outer membrane protein [Siphonobacter sp. SORGH_AS_0500]PKK36832.1 RagB/SusD family nutrient uptake outer membrane protein [Siphonobacter sp. SORGH_AS_0500]